MSKMFPKTVGEKLKHVWYGLLSMCHLLALAIVVLPSSVFAAAAAGSADASSLSLKGGTSIIAPEFITALFTGVAAILGVIWQKAANRRALERKDDEIRRIRAELPQPLTVEQTSYQASWKANDKDHENLFGRVSKLEMDISRVEAKTDATLQFIQKQLDSLTSMTSQLFDRIINGKNKGKNK